jgi:glycosyltransferase involved in cell wall biosynthesis
MKVLMMTPSYYPIKGGAETVIETITRGLNRSGISTEIMTFNMNRKWEPKWHSNTKIVDGIKVYGISGFNWFPFEHSDRVTAGINLIPGSFRRYLLNYDMVHFHIGDLSFPFFAKATQVPKIAQLHGSINFHPSFFLERFITKKIANAYIAISKVMENDLLKIGIPQDKLYYLPNSVDTNLFYPRGEKESNLVLFIARITFSKGLHVLLTALKLLKTPVHLVIIGPSDFDHKYFEEIKNMINSENSKGIHTVDYIGKQEKHNIIKYCQKAALLVLPSLKDASSLVSLEALSCETPVIATPIGGIPEIIINSKNGFLIPPNNFMKLANAMQYLLDNESERKKFGRHGRKFILETYSEDRAISNLCKIYEKVINSQSSVSLKR